MYSLSRRLLYFAYYLKTLDWKRLKLFLDFYSKKQKRNKFAIGLSIFRNSIKYNISILEYFLFDFGTKTHLEKCEWAGTGYMYEYQKLMNPAKTRDILNDKIKFLTTYRDFVKHKFSTIKDLENEQTFNSLVSNTSGRIVLKNSFGQCGRGIEVRNSFDFNQKTLIKRLIDTGNDFVEEFVCQHDALMALSPSGLNTVRIVTQINKKDKVEIIAARLRITVDSYVDNLAAGNMAAPIDTKSGKIYKEAVYSDITKLPESKHPVTGVEIIGFEIPFWEETIKMIKTAALIEPKNKSIGWDVAITNRGPELIEGNHDWCKLLWQLPDQKGLKNILEDYRLGNR